MPQVTVYIREEDITKWKALPKKEEFIHNALNGQVFADKDYIITEAPKPVKTPEDAEKALEKAVRADLAAADVMGIKLCRHGNPLGACFDKGSDRRCRV